MQQLKYRYLPKLSYPSPTCWQFTVRSLYLTTE